MLSPRLNNCPECADIPSLLKKIDCKLAELGNNLYNNISYMLNKPVPADDILQLIGYRRILTHKYCNPNYVHKYSVKMIASRVIRLTLGCVSRCNEPERCLEEPCDIIVVPNPPTTTTSTTRRITTTTTSSSSTSTSTSTSSTTSSTSTSSSTTTSTTTLIPISTTTTSSTSSTTSTTTTAVPTTSTTTTAMILPSVTVCGRIITNENSTLTVLSDGTNIPYAADITEFNTHRTNNTPCYVYWNFDPAEAYRGLLYNQTALNNLAPPGWRGLTQADVDYFIDCNPYKPNTNLYLADPGNWNPTAWTNKSNAGETGMNFKGYGTAQWYIPGNINWIDNGLFETQGYASPFSPYYASDVSIASGYGDWGVIGITAIDYPMYARFIKL